MSALVRYSPEVEAALDALSLTMARADLAILRI